MNFLMIGVLYCFVPVNASTSFNFGRDMDGIFSDLAEVIFQGSPDEKHAKMSFSHTKSLTLSMISLHMRNAADDYSVDLVVKAYFRQDFYLPVYRKSDNKLSNNVFENS